jgi:hypothetical protein
MCLASASVAVPACRSAEITPPPSGSQPASAGRGRFIQARKERLHHRRSGLEIGFGSDVPPIRLEGNRGWGSLVGLMEHAIAAIIRH